MNLEKVGVFRERYFKAIEDDEIRANKTKEKKEMSNLLLPDPPKQENGFKRLPFLKAEDLKGKGATLQIAGEPRIVESNFGPQIFVDVRLGKKIFTWPVRLKSGNYAKLVGKFSNNPKKWNRGKVQVIPGEYNGKEYVQVLK